jgi:hypothetical protein
MNTHRHFDREILILAMLFCALVWIYMVIEAVRMEDRNGEVVQVRERVWELGKGERNATPEERAFDARRR